MSDEYVGVNWLSEEAYKRKWCERAIAVDDVNRVAANRLADGSPSPACLCLGSACTKWVWHSGRRIAGRCSLVRDD